MTSSENPGCLVGCFLLLLGLLLGLPGLPLLLLLLLLLPLLLVILAPGASVRPLVPSFSLRFEVWFAGAAAT